MKIDDQYYLLNYDTVRPFASAEVVSKLGYNPDEIITASTTDIAGLDIGMPITAESTGSPLGQMIRAKENKQIYYLLDGVYHVVTDPAIAKSRFPNLTIVDLPIATLATSTRGEPLLFKDGILMGSKLTNKIYVIEHGYKRHIPSETVFSALGYDLNDVVWVNEFTEDEHPTGQPMSLPSDVTGGSQTDDADVASGIISANPKMVFVPENKTEYIGTKFDTPVNTYVVADATTGKILAGKNVDVVRPIASFAKVMSAYRMLTTGLSLSKITTYRAKRDKVQYNYFRITDGERVKNSDLLDAMLVSSLNAPVSMLLANVDTDKAHFLKGLNSLAKSWGLKKTTFTDPAGEDVTTVSTAREYLTLWRKTTAGKTIPAELGKASYRYTEALDKDKHPTHFDSNTNKLMEKADLPFDITMSKTGYLDEAGAGLVMEIKRKTDGKKFVIISMGNPDYAHRFVEPEKLARWAIETF
jgi:D-alanyl-D-alanine endopeptidase (penicillin-binding protein 7)